MPSTAFGDGAGGLLILKRHAVGEAQQVDQFIPGQVAAVGHADFDLEWIAPVDGRRARDGRIEIGRNFLLQPQQDLFLADRGEAVGRRAHDLDAVDGLVQPLRLVTAMVWGLAFGLRVGRFADFLCDPGADAGEILLQRDAQIARRRLLHHLDERRPARRRTDAA